MNIQFKIYLKQCILIAALSTSIGKIKGQVGLVAGPFFWIPNFNTPLYREDNLDYFTKGGMVNLDINKRLAFNFINYRLFDEKVTNDKYWKGFLTQDILPLRYSEINASYMFLKKDLVKQGEGSLYDGPIARTFGLRIGAISSQRMVQLTPNKFHYIDNNYGNPIPKYDYINEFVVTSLKQKVLFAGITLNKYKRMVPAFTNHYSYWDRYGYHEGTSNGKQLFHSSPRKRKWEQYFDIMFGIKQTYGNYIERFGNDSIQTQGSNIANINPFGWRFGVRRVTYNTLGHSFLIEFGQYPGQKIQKDIDEIWKNCFVLVGFHFTLGHWFGEYYNEE